MVTRLLPILTVLFVLAFIQKSMAEEKRPRTVTLASLRDKSRPLLIFAPDEKNQSFLDQSRIVAAGEAELRKSAVILVAATESTPVSLCGGLLKQADCAELAPEELSEVRRRFHIAPNAFTALLLGKDGGEKFRSSIPVTIETLNSLIDAMPMRRREMQKEKQDGHPE